MKRFISVLTLMFAVASCATVDIESYPADAKVSVVLPGKAVQQEVGKTPFKASIGDYDEFVNEGALVFVVSKPGYLSQHFVVPNIAHTDIEITTNLLPDLPTNYQEVNKLIGLAFTGERAILQKRFDEAQKIAKEIQDLNPNIAVAYELIGTAQYLQNNLREARYAWQRVLELEPQNFEAQKMLANVEARMGIRGKPAKKAQK